MPDPQSRLKELLAADRRYAPQAYLFVFEALRFTQEQLKRAQLGSEEERHVTGQELCEGIRRFATEQFGLMAITVLQSWGITCTGDFGQIVYNLIRSGDMKKSDGDSLDDFDDVYDFEEAFCRNFRIELK